MIPGLELLGRVYLEVYAPSLQEHEAARLRPISWGRHQGMSQTGGFTFFLQRLSTHGDSFRYLGDYFRRALGWPSFRPTLPRLLMRCFRSSPTP